MGTKANYTDSSSGKRCTTPTFGTLEMARSYVAQLKGARDVDFVDTAAAACATVTPVDAGTAEKQRAASRAFYAPIKEARRGIIVKEERPSRENDHERDMEVFGAALAAGVGHAAAMDEVDYVRRRG